MLEDEDKPPKPKDCCWRIQKDRRLSAVTHSEGGKRTRVAWNSSAPIKVPFSKALNPHLRQQQQQQQQSVLHQYGGPVLVLGGVALLSGQEDGT